MMEHCWVASRLMLHLVDHPCSIGNNEQEKKCKGKVNRMDDSILMELCKLYIDKICQGPEFDSLIYSIITLQGKFCKKTLFSDSLCSL